MAQEKESVYKVDLGDFMSDLDKAVEIASEKFENETPESEPKKKTIPKKQVPEKNEQVRRGRPAADEKLVQRSFYITREQAKKLKKIAADQETDVSSLIRKAIDKQYKETST